MKTRHSRHESQRTKHSKSSQRLHVEALDRQVGQDRRQESDDDDDKVQDVPTVSQVGARMKRETVGDDFQRRLTRENHFICFIIFWGSSERG